MTLTDDQTRLNVTNSLRVLPGFSGDVTVGLKYPSDAPIYWELPPEFLGDKVGTECRAFVAALVVEGWCTIIG